MEIKRSAISIEGNEVEKVDSINGLDFYQWDSKDGDEVIIYICKGSGVLRKVSIEADCGQNFGYISGIDFSKVD